MYLFRDCRHTLAGVACLLLVGAASCTYNSAGRKYVPLDPPSLRTSPGLPQTFLPNDGREVPEEGESPALTTPLKVTIHEAILLALENNRELSVQRLEPDIRQTQEDAERAAFDPTLNGSFSGSRDHVERETDATSSRMTAELTISELFPTGTEVALAARSERVWSDLYSDEHSSLVELTVTQALLNGAGIEPNLARLRQARLDTSASQYELRGFAESLIAQIESTYWDYALAERRIEIFEESLGLAEQQQRETEERIKIGKLAETELAAAQAEVALRREELINARSQLATTRLRLLRLLNPPGPGLWAREILLRDRPAVPDVRLDNVEKHVEVGMRMRPDLNEARLRLQHGDLEIVRTKNGLLPKLDVFITLGKTGYADSFGGSVRDLDGESYSLSGGISVEYPLLNRQAEALFRRANLTREQSGEALGNLEQLVQVDVRSAYIEVTRAAEQVTATAATRQLQEEKLRAETEKFRVGRSTTLLVAQVQRDLVASRISEVDAVVSYLKALVDMFRLEGSLLERRGLSVGGIQQ